MPCLCLTKHKAPRRGRQNLPHSKHISNRRENKQIRPETRKTTSRTHTNAATSFHFECPKPYVLDLEMPNTVPIADLRYSRTPQDKEVPLSRCVSFRRAPSPQWVLHQWCDGQAHRVERRMKHMTIKVDPSGHGPSQVGSGGQGARWNSMSRRSSSDLRRPR